MLYMEVSVNGGKTTTEALADNIKNVVKKCGSRIIDDGTGREFVFHGHVDIISDGAAAHNYQFREIDIGPADGCICTLPVYRYVDDCRTIDDIIDVVARLTISYSTKVITDAMTASELEISVS